MIYFLINNTFHLYDLDHLANRLKKYDLGLIQVPYSLEPIKTDKRFSSVFCFDRLPYTIEFLNNIKRNFWHLIKQNQPKIKKVKEVLRPCKNDIIFVFTETEILNQIIISIFKKKGAKIYLLEDGDASAIFYNLDSDPLKKRAQFFKWFVRIYYRIPGFRPYHRSNYYYPMMADNTFSGACFFSPTTIKRNIPVFILKKPYEPIDNLDPNNALFINQPLYGRYTDLDNYLLDLNKIFETITINFDKVYFKFHPDEITNPAIQEKIKSILNLYSNVHIVEDARIIENVIKDIKAKYAISWFSSALKNLLFYGIEPVYIYHLTDYLRNNMQQKTNLLNSLNYEFPASLIEIKPGYYSGLDLKIGQRIGIEELVEKSIIY